MTANKTAFEEVMQVRGKGMPQPGEVTIENADPILATSFKVGETTAAVPACAPTISARSQSRLMSRGTPPVSDVTASMARVSKRTLPELPAIVRRCDT